MAGFGLQQRAQQEGAQTSLEALQQFSDGCSSNINVNERKPPQNANKYRKGKKKRKLKRKKNFTSRYSTQLFPSPNFTTDQLQLGSFFATHATIAAPTTFPIGSHCQHRYQSYRSKMAPRTRSNISILLSGTHVYHQIGPPSPSSPPPSRTRHTRHRTATLSVQRFFAVGTTKLIIRRTAQCRIQLKMYSVSIWYPFSFYQSSKPFLFYGLYVSVRL